MTRRSVDRTVLGIRSLSQTVDSATKRSRWSGCVENSIEWSRSIPLARDCIHRDRSDRPSTSSCVSAHNHFHDVGNRPRIAVSHSTTGYESLDVDRKCRLPSVPMAHNERQRNESVRLAFVHQEPHWNLCPWLTERSKRRSMVRVERVNSGWVEENDSMEVYEPSKRRHGDMIRDSLGHSPCPRWPHRRSYRIEEHTATSTMDPSLFHRTKSLFVQDWRWSITMNAFSSIHMTFIAEITHRFFVKHVFGG